MNLLTNKYVLYFVAFISIVNILGYFFDSKFGAIAFFALVAFLTLYFTSNMIIVLGVALLATNFLGGLAELFKPMQTIDTTPNNNKYKKEGFTNQEPPQKSDEKNIDINIEGTMLNNSKKFQPSMFQESVKQGGMNTDLAVKFEQSKQNESAKDFFDSNITSQNIKAIQEKTDALMKEQSQLMNQVADFGPLLNNSLQAISNLTSGNIGSVISQLTGNLDELYAKYPDAFPKDYQSQTNDLKKKMNDINDMKTKIDQAGEKNPELKQHIDKIKESMNI
jgi:hypothetical protein